MLNNPVVARSSFSFILRSRTSLAAFVAIGLLSHDQWHLAGNSWQTCVLQPRCVIIDNKGKFALVVACQLYAARVWRLRLNGEHMLLDPSFPMEWVVVTDITAWRVVPWDPIVAVDRDASQAQYGCVAFVRSRPAVSALAWAVANHRLTKQHLKRFTKDRDPDGVEELLGELLQDHEDRAFYMTLFRRGKSTADPPPDMAEMTKAAMGVLDQDNLKSFQVEKDKLIGPQLGDDLAVGSDDEEPALQPMDDTIGAEQEELEAVVPRLDEAEEDVIETQAAAGEGVGAPMLKLEAPGKGRRRLRAAPATSNVTWAASWLPPAPPDATKFGLTRVVAKSKWTVYYDHPAAGLPSEGHTDDTHTHSMSEPWLLVVVLS